MRKSTFLLLLPLVLSIGLASCGGDAPGSSEIVGTWTLDADALLASMQKVFEAELPEGLPAEVVEQARKSMAEQATTFTAVIDMKADGTWTANFTAADGEEKASGTWTEKDGKLTIVTTHQDGKAKEKPEEITARIEDGVLYAKPDKDQPFDLVLRKK